MAEEKATREVAEEEATEEKALNPEEAWKSAAEAWSKPSVPSPVAVEPEELPGLEEIGPVLKDELAFMKYPEFQVYANLGKIRESFPEAPQRGAEAIFKHELGHRFCPYDVVTSIVLAHNAKKGFPENLPYSSEEAAKTVLNLWADETINTRLVRNGDTDITWAYKTLSKSRGDKKLWRVYARSMEIAWGEKMLPDCSLTKEEEEGARELAGLFEQDPFYTRQWNWNIRNYASIISRFFESQDSDRGLADNIAGNIPKEIDRETAAKVAKRLAEIGSNGLPTNSEAVKEFRDIMAGYGQGDPVEASIQFYDMLSEQYSVMFAKRPFGRPRINPFQPVKWQPSMNIDKLDIEYSATTGGRLVPGVNTYSWKTRRREAHGGFEEVVPNIDIYLDSSGSMPNPIESVSLPVLAGFVVAKKANRKNAHARATSFSGKGQSETTEMTRELEKVYKTLVKYFNGGTVFPVSQLLEGPDPRQVLIITDTFIGNTEETADAIRDFKRRHRGNNVSVYAITSIPDADYLRRAGAEVIHDTTTSIFKRVIGKAEEVYSR